MSIKSLAALVFLLVSGVLGSAYCYLSADRSPAARESATAVDCCNTQTETFGAKAEGCVDGQTRQLPCETSCSQVRQLLAVRSRMGTAQELSVESAADRRGAGTSLGGS